jgi:hypothetical protein
VNPLLIFGVKRVSIVTALYGTGFVVRIAITPIADAR